MYHTVASAERQPTIRSLSNERHAASQPRATAATPSRLASVKTRLEKSQVPVLLVSRLIPGGRVPVLLAAAFVGLAWRTFVVANVPACALWAGVYAGIGVAGGSIFPRPWEGVVAAVILILVINQTVSWITKRREARAEASEASPSEA